MYLQLRQGHAALLWKEPNSLVKINVFVIDTLFFLYITKFQVTIYAPQKHN